MQKLIESKKKAFNIGIRQFLLNRRILSSRIYSHPSLNHIIDLLRPFEVGIPLKRIGSNGDGGYLVPDYLEGITSCFSPGVSNNCDFELALAERGIKCFMADYSVSAPPQFDENFFFIKKFVGATSSEQYIRFSDWILENSRPNDELLLQMDIEGDEYLSILDTGESVLKRFRIAVIEFHNLEQLASQSGFASIWLTLSRLRSIFTPVCIHPNNIQGQFTFGGLLIPSVIEVTYLRSDHVKTLRPFNREYLSLLKTNSTVYPEVTLEDQWYRSSMEENDS